MFSLPVDGGSVELSWGWPRASSLRLLCGQRTCPSQVSPRCSSSRDGQLTIDRIREVLDPGLEVAGHLSSDGASAGERGASLCRVTTGHSSTWGSEVRMRRGLLARGKTRCRNCRRRGSLPCIHFFQGVAESSFQGTDYIPWCLVHRHQFLPSYGFIHRFLGFQSYFLVQGSVGD